MLSAQCAAWFEINHIPTRGTLGALGNSICVSRANRPKPPPSSCLVCGTRYVPFFSQSASTNSVQRARRDGRNTVLFAGLPPAGKRFPMSTRQKVYITPLPMCVCVHLPRHPDALERCVAAAGRLPFSALQTSLLKYKQRPRDAHSAGACCQLNFTPVALSPTSLASCHLCVCCVPFRTRPLSCSVCKVRPRPVRYVAAST